ncbi:MAG: hypothetical protein QXD04_07260 [Candidatus Bathyarchaeia archaeon]
MGGCALTMAPVYWPNIHGLRDPGEHVPVDVEYTNLFGRPNPISSFIGHLMGGHIYLLSSLFGLPILIKIILEIMGLGGFILLS